MVNPLSQLENLAERLVEGTFARILGARLQPIEVARHIARAMEDGQVINAQGEIVFRTSTWSLSIPTTWGPWKVTRTRCGMS